MNVAVRPMRVEDLPEVLTIESESFPDPWSRQMFESELFASNRIWSVQRALTGLWLDTPA